MGAWGYYGHLAKMAFKRTWALTDSKVPVIIFTGLSFAIGSVIHYGQTGAAGPSDKWAEWLVYSVAGGIIAFLLLWLFSFLQAPYHLHVQTLADAESRRTSDRATHQAEMRTIAVESATAQAAILERLDQLQAERDAAVQSHSALRAEVDAELATLDDISEAFRVLSDKTSNKLRDEPTAIKNPEEWLNKVRGIAALTLRPIFAREVDVRINSARNSDPALQGRHQLGECVNWLNGWNGRLTTGNIRRDCLLAELKAAMERL